MKYFYTNGATYNADDIIGAIRYAHVSGLTLRYDAIVINSDYDNAMVFYTSAKYAYDAINAEYENAMRHAISTGIVEDAFNSMYCEAKDALEYHKRKIKVIVDRANQLDIDLCLVMPDE